MKLEIMDIFTINSAQRKVLVVAFLLLAVSCVIVPWKIAPGDDNYLDHAQLGYEPVFDPPKGAPATVDKPRLVLSWAAIGFVAAGLFFLVGGKPGSRGAER